MAAEPAWWCHVCMRTVPVSQVPAHQHSECTCGTCKPKGR